MLVCLSAYNSYAQDILWEKSFGGQKAEYLFDAIPTPDYGFILAGSSISGKGGTKSDEGKGNFDYWIWKMNEKGGQEWQKSFGGSHDDFLQCIQLTQDGGFILGGTSNSGKDGDKREDAKGESDFWIIKLNAKGGEQWQRTIGGTGVDRLYTVSCTADGGFLIGGTSASDKTPADSKGKEDVFGKKDTKRGNLDYWIVKLNSEGNIDWQKTYGGDYIDELRAIAPTSDGGCLVGGYSNSPKSGDKTDDTLGEGDYWMLKLDPKGELLWQKTFGGDKDDALYALTPTKDGGFIVGGNSDSGAVKSKLKANGKGVDFWVVKFEQDGTLLWQETYDFGKLDVLTSLVENEDGTIVIGGYAQSEKNQTSTKGRFAGSDKEGINDYIALKISSTGEELWSKTVGSKGDEVMRKLIETRDGGYVLAGTSNGDKSRDKDSKVGDNDFWVVKLKDTSKPKKARMELEAMPNPAVTYTNAIVNYEYDYGTATLYDLSGRQLQSIEINGERTIPVTFGNIPQGVYIIKVKTNKGEHALKVIKK